MEKITIPGSRDKILSAIVGGESHIELKDPDRPLSHKILGPPFRDYFIKRVKAPFQKAIILYSKKYPEPTKRNCSGNWTEPFMDIFDKLVDYVQFKRDLFIAIRRIVLGEIEHDNLYRDPILAMLEWLVEDILDGKIPPREEGKPEGQYWSEPKPYGGRHSIIHRIRERRRQINDVLGRKYIEGDT